MPFNRPTILEHKNRAVAAIETELPGADARVARSNLDVLTSNDAAMAHIQHGHIDYVAKQILVDTASHEELDRHATLWGVSRKAATFAQGYAVLTGADGTVIPTNTKLQRGDGVVYLTTTEETIAGGSADINIISELTGVSNNAVSGVGLALTSPIVGMDNDGVVNASGITLGSENEDDTSLQTRVIARMQQPPHGGAGFDYKMWALEVSDVTRAWVSAQKYGAGSVAVTFVKDGLADIIPDAAAIAEVQDYINERRPVTAEVFVEAPVAVPLDITLSITPDNTAVRAAIEAELADLISRESEPGATLLISHIRESVSIAAGESDHNITIPAGDVTHSTDQMAILGVITWL